MKSCIIKKADNGRVFHNTIYWKDFPHDTFLNQCLDVPYVGYVQALEADFLVYEEIDPVLLDNYDIVIYLSNNSDPLGYKPKGSLYVVPCEPTDSLAKDHVDGCYVINNYYTEQIPPNHLVYPYTYDLDTFYKYRTKEKQKFVFKQRRSPVIDLPEGFEYQSEGGILPLHYSAWDLERVEYIKKLNSCKYAYSTCLSFSPGQVIAEASMLGVIILSTPQKLITKLLLPEFCLINTAEEVKEKIEMLEKDIILYKNILAEIDANVKKHLSLSSFKQFIEQNEKIYSNNNN
jgi:hypothetical protein